MNVPAQTLMLLARLADWYGLNRLEHWCYDTILAHGWDGVETFIRLDYEPKD